MSRGCVRSEVAIILGGDYRAGNELLLASTDGWVVAVSPPSNSVTNNDAEYGLNIVSAQL